MCIVHKGAGGKCQLRVANAGLRCQRFMVQSQYFVYHECSGDSRVLLGRRDGRIVDGGGTEQGDVTCKFV